MKRFALLLAAVGLGSGCVVTTSPTCDSGTLTVDWSLVAASGASGVSCTSLSLPADVQDFDVWIDGSLADTLVPCTSFTSFAGVASGVHDVMVAGFDSLNNVVVRGVATVDVCGNTSVLVDAGEGYVDIQPSNCDALGDYLTYSISDATISPSYVIRHQTPPDTLTHTCGGGILERVPWGYYDLTEIEETNLSGATVYKSKCTTTYVDVPTWGTTTYNVAFTGVAPCF